MRQVGAGAVGREICRDTVLAAGEVARPCCGEAEQVKRRIMGLVALTVGVGTIFVLVVNGSPRFLRLLIFFPFWIAGLGLLQAREKT